MAVTADGSKYAFCGQIQEKDPQSHAMDGRGFVMGWSNGLTKREYMALHILQGIVSTAPSNIDLDPNYAVKLADKLIQELGAK